MASVRLLPSNAGTNTLTRLQDHEYHMAMRMRRLYPWLISGACHVAKTAAHHAVMQHHSLFFQGNDVELGILADAMGYDVAHIPFDVPTTVPDRCRPWLRQRNAWIGGEFRVYLANIRFARRQPFFYLYGVVVVFALTPLRIWTLWTAPVSVLAIFIVYVLALVRFHRRRLDRYVLLLPFYMMIGTLVLTPIGWWSYASMAIRHKNWGVMRPGDDYVPDKEPVWWGAPTFVSSFLELRADLAAVGFGTEPAPGHVQHCAREALVAWQEELISIGYDLGPAGADGVFGELTAAASRAEAPWLGVGDPSLPTMRWIDEFRERQVLFADSRTTRLGRVSAPSSETGTSPESGR